MNSIKLPQKLTLLDDFPPQSYQEWKNLATADLEGAVFEKRLITHTYDGLDIQPLYTDETVHHLDERSGFPGQAPYTRGMQALGHALTGWDIRQEVSTPDPIETNAVILEELRQGATSIELKLDAAASEGLDADDPRAVGLSGYEGNLIYHRGDLARALDGVLLDIAPLSLDTGANFLPGAALLAALWDEQQLDVRQVAGSFNADPIGALMLHGSLPMPLASAMMQLADLAAWTAHAYPRVKAVRVSTAAYHHAGASSVQDLAFAMGTAVEYLRAMTSAGMDINAAIGQILFHDALGCRFFHGIAKLRALRTLWGQLAAACGADPEAIGSLRISTETSRRVLTRRDPWINLLRNTTACFAGAIGGADSITTLPLDSAIGPSDAFSRHLARNTQLILEEECLLSRVMDPSGGSYFIESLTEHLAQKAWSLFQQIEAQGGMIKAVKSGFIHEAIQTVEQQREKDVATREVGITGVSEHPDIFEAELTRPDFDTEKLCQEAIANLRSWRREHPTKDALETLQQVVTQADRSLGALTKALIAAARQGATIGQLTLTLAGLTEDQDTPHLPPLTLHPYAAAFEELRNATDAYTSRQNNRRPKVFLVNLGAPKEFLARTTYATNFFAAGGFESVTNDGFTEVEEGIDAFTASGAHIAVICSTDQRYTTEVPHLAPLLRAAGARTVILAGHPGPHEPEYRSAGVNRFIYRKCNVLDILRSLLEEEGVLEPQAVT